MGNGNRCARWNTLELRLKMQMSWYTNVYVYMVHATGTKRMYSVSAILKKLLQTETYSVQSWYGYKCEVNFQLRTNFMENDSQSTAIRIIAFQQCIF